MQLNTKRNCRPIGFPLGVLLRVSIMGMLLEFDLLSDTRGSLVFSHLPPFYLSYPREEWWLHRLHHTCQQIDQQWRREETQWVSIAVLFFLSFFTAKQSMPVVWLKFRNDNYSLCFSYMLKMPLYCWNIRLCLHTGCGLYCTPHNMAQRSQWFHKCVDTYATVGGVNRPPRAPAIVRIITL